MFSYKIDDVALLELRDVERVYVTYFARFGEYAKGERWAQRFYEDYRQSIEEIKRDPYIHGICRVHPFDCVDTTYRCFTVGWFTIFYTVEGSSVIVWHVRSSKSDFSTLSSR
ncbi:type II toxin-antitoxin system RelE/ParE family toxin [Adlercreutzia sp. ZJ242]|uniref:type II toxin-antitoxin system RelE/ParE family toxin n=1 Tax=Adlercreutzia sp. ZJ242 TaxID=2709409 RepID=UPI0013EC7E7C|nr:hypothetical protein [Adlercreutzia sp. ZJ242]